MAREYYFGSLRDDADRLALIGQTHNGASFDNLRRFAGSLTGARVLDIGAGDGSFAELLREAAGPSGRVGVTDLASSGPSDFTAGGIAYYCSDIEQEVPPGAPYDVVHARMVLSHVTDPLRALNNAVSALAPGGVIYVADLDKITSMTLVDVPPFDAARQAIVDDIVASSDYDPHFGRRLPALLRSCDVTAIVVHGTVEFHFGGVSRPHLARHVAAYDRIPQDRRAYPVDAVEAAVEDDRLISMGSLMVHALARRARP